MQAEKCTADVAAEPQSKMIRYEDAVSEGKKVAAAIERNRWRLGEIAANLEPRYGENTLEKFGEAIGLSYDTVREYRQVYLAWKDENTGRPAFSVGKELAKHPQKAEVIKREPKITKRRARQIMRDQKSTKATNPNTTRTASDTDALRTDLPAEQTAAPKSARLATALQAFDALDGDERAQFLEERNLMAVAEAASPEHGRLH